MFSNDLGVDLGTSNVLFTILVGLYGYGKSY